jgi:outer membrane protein TolC
MSGRAVAPERPMYGREVGIMRWVTIFASAAVAAAACSAVGAIEPEVPELRLSLGECLRSALENNLDLVIARKDPEIAQQEIEASRARFDGVIAADIGANDSDEDLTITDNLAATVADGLSDSTSLSGNVSWTDQLQYGATYEAALTLSDVDSQSRQVNPSVGIPQDSDFTSTEEGLTLRYEMPLLRGFGREVNTVDVLLAEGGLEVSREDLRLRAMLTLQEVEGAYWDLLAARESLRVARESLKLAQDLLELTRKKVEVGTLAPIETTQAEAGVASREEGVIVAETGVGNAEDNLRRLLAIPGDDPRWSQTILPTDRPVFEPRAVDTEAALATALERRPEVLSARRQLRDRELSERVARKNVRHALGLLAEVTPNRSDQDFVSVFGALPGSDTTTESDGRQWRVALNYTVPLRNREAKANHAIAALNSEKSRLGLTSVEQDILVDVRTAARNVESGVKRVAAARSNTSLQRQTLEAEQRKYDNGMSTSFEVLQIQTDLSNAQLSEIQAMLDYVKSLAEVERAQGTLLEARGLTLPE